MLERKTLWLHPLRLQANDLLHTAPEQVKIFRNTEVLWREEDDSKAEAYQGLNQGSDVSDIGTSVLFADGFMVTLNILGTEIWKLCDGRELDDIIAALVNQFDVEEDLLRKDILLFLDELAGKGFIRYE
jgi:pyrroloquinoline quinone biosynthesis protein D